MLDPCTFRQWSLDTLANWLGQARHGSIESGSTNAVSINYRLILTSLKIKPTMESPSRKYMEWHAWSNLYNCQNLHAKWNHKGSLVP